MSYFVVEKCTETSCTKHDDVLNQCRLTGVGIPFYIGLGVLNSFKYDCEAKRQLSTYKLIKLLERN